MTCQTKYCRNRRRSDRRICSKCEMRKWRSTRRLQAAFATLRDHARARGIEFALDFQDFAQFAAGCLYAEKTGIHAQCVTVDRIDNLRGYVPGNIQPLSRAENSRKRNRQDEIRMNAGRAWQR